MNRLPTREKSWQCFYNALTALKDNLVKFGLYKELEQDYINYGLHFSLWNLDTLTGAKKEVLFDKLKKEWFAALGIANKPKEYFYNKKEFAKFEKIMNQSFQEVYPDAK